MGAIDGPLPNAIKLFKYMNNNNIEELNVNLGDNWDDVKTNNKTINSIFNTIDDGDGIVQAKELNAVNKIFLYIDKLVDKFKGDNTIEDEELEVFETKLNSGDINIADILNSDDNTGVTNWNEGLNRNISQINIAKNIHFKSELVEIANEQGFKINEIESGDDIWVEDSSIRRADGKKYVSMYGGEIVLNDGSFTSERNNKSVGGGARVFSRGDAFNLEIDNSIKYYGTSYLEGGNVLNTLSKDGKPSAIIGESSIAYTLDVMELENTPENVARAKVQIAEDLGLSPNDVTFIPQYDFHIDMLYHPLNNGEIAIPDFDEAIKILKENSISGMSEEEKNSRITSLEQLRDNTAAIREEADDKLKSSGYKLVKIPCFTTNNKDKTNFMNGVGGTSSKTGDKFFITNKSEYADLQEIVAGYFKKAGIDKVYFVSSTDYLRRMGGVDCLTQEE